MKDSPLCSRLGIRLFLLFSLVLVAVGVSAQTNQSGPSLRETEEWMSRTVNSATFAPSISHGLYMEGLFGDGSFEHTSISFGADMQQLERNGTGCYCKITAIIESSSPPNSVFDDFTAVDVYRFHLKDIDPASITAAKEDMTLARVWVAGTVQFVTADDKPAIHFQTTQWKVADYHHTSKDNFDFCIGPDKSCEKKDELHTGVQIGVDSLEFAQRFAKAFRHAVELCGGKPSIF